MPYTWCWVDGEDEDSGKSWIQITTLDGEEMAVIMCRDYHTVFREHPEWVDLKVAYAERIVAALNALPR